MVKTHLFGEMDIDFSRPVDQIYKKAAHIAEACGYVVTHEKHSDGIRRYLEFCGEDIQDGYIVVTRAYYYPHKDPQQEMITHVEKTVMKERYAKDGYPEHEVIETIRILTR
jgi:hypothetical protein